LLNAKPIIKYASKTTPVAIAQCFKNSFCNAGTCFILFKKFYLSPPVKSRLDKGKKMIKKLFKYYIKNPGEVPAKFKNGVEIEVAVKDYIAGMTDKFLEKEVKKAKV